MIITVTSMSGQVAKSTLPSKSIADAMTGRLESQVFEIALPHSSDISLMRVSATYYGFGIQIRTCREQAKWNRQNSAQILSYEIDKTLVNFAAQTPEEYDVLRWSDHVIPCKHSIGFTRKFDEHNLIVRWDFLHDLMGWRASLSK